MNSLPWRRVINSHVY